MKSWEDGNKFQFKHCKEDGSVVKENIEVEDGAVFRCLYTSGEGYPYYISDFVCKGKGVYPTGEKINVLLEDGLIYGVWLDFPLRYISENYHVLDEGEEASILSQQKNLKAAKKAAELASKEAEDKAEREEQERREGEVQAKYAEAKETGKEVLISKWWDWNDEENCLERFMIFALPDGTDRLERRLEY